MNETYGVKGAVHTLEQRRPWNSEHGLGHLPNRETFDVEFSPTGLILQETNYTNAGDISRRSHFVYDDAGQLIRSTVFDKNGTEMAFSTFEYSEGSRMCTTRSRAGIVVSRQVEEYDGGLLTILNSYDASGRPTRIKKLEYVEGKLSLASSSYYGPDGSLHELSISRFDSFGRVIEAFGLTPDGKPNGDGRYVYEYDNDGRTLRVLSFNDLADTETPNGVTGFLYKCDHFGNWIERTEYHRFRSDVDWTKRVTTRTLSYYPAD